MPVDSTTSGCSSGSDAIRGTGLGVLVGGRSSRMGGQPKGLLLVPGSDESLVVHALRVGAEAGCAPRWLVGDLEAYDPLATAHARELNSAAGGADQPAFRGRLQDDPAGVGPLGGLRALLQAASASGLGQVIAVACDMPYVTPALLTALREHPSEAAVLAARRGPEAPWEPLLARYRPALLLPAVDAALAAGERSFQRLLARVTVAEFEAPGLARALDDWDRPEDVR
jgi:molybdopterin-guanine dinucleotide biosynthesis protein A